MSSVAANTTAADDAGTAVTVRRSPHTFRTPVTQLLGIRHPILLAGMNVAASPRLCAAVTNAGGCGVIGGMGYTPKFLRIQINMVKKALVDKSAPFGVDLLLPKVGDGARATNSDYTNGRLPELIDIIIEEKVKLFVVAVGVPPKWAVDKLHKAGILVMNMVGAPKHVKYALDAGADLICAQGGEGGGHTGDLATSVLIPAVVDLCKGHTSSLHGGPVHVVAGGGVFDGRGLASMLAFGASAVWVGTRFVAAVESGAPAKHKQSVLKCGYHDTVRTLIYTGRPLRINKTESFVAEWERDRQADIKEMCAEGTVPIYPLMAEKISDGLVSRTKAVSGGHPMLMGQCAGAINDVTPAAVIIETMVAEAVECVRQRSAQIVSAL